MLAMGSCVCVCARTSACARSLRALTRHYTPPHTHLQPPRTGAVIACRLLMCLIVLDVCSHRLRPIRRQLFDVVCTQGISDVSGDVRRRRPDATGDVRGTGPRDRAHARAPACQRGSCPTRDYATPRRCDLKPRSESRAQYSNMRGWDTCFKPSWDMCEPWNMKCGILSDCGTKKVSIVQNNSICGLQLLAHNTIFDPFWL